ncbi:Galactose mutarotase-like domain superfamily [Sesbania bispinosa]|nr:Galactose mutarotase-like domain superfamily [Sesbania bispinosa]
MASFLSLSLPKLNLIKASSAATTSTPSISTPEALNEKFGRKGIKFLESDNNIPIVELTVRNGSSLSLRIPDAHVTSYKPKVFWKDDGFEEVLYTVPATETGLYKAKGGIGLVLNEVVQPGAKEILPSTLEWTVSDVETDAIDALQVELSCTSRFFDMTYVVTLYPVSMATAVIVMNKAPKPVTLTNAILSHFRFKKRGGAAIQGLKSCSYCTHPPLDSPFQILTPAEAMKSEPPRWFSFGSEPEVKQGSWAQQGVPITILENKMSRVYAAPPKERSKAFYNTPPSKYETIDQGRELFFRVIRMGFEDIYVSSPGSLSEKYGEDYFVCTGPASILVPVTVNPGEEWRGAQVIEHDNLS